MSFKFSDGYENHPSSWQSANTCTDISVGTTIDEHWPGLHRSTVSPSNRKFRARYVKGLCVHFHLRRYSCSLSRIVNTTTTEDFLQAFRRMANRRGMAKVIHSDNQTGFHKAEKVFKTSTQRMQLMKIDPNVVEDKLANQGVRWKFITERASHRGGHWERVCWQLKEPLRKMLGKAFLNYTEMVTVPTNRHRSNRSKKSASFSSGVTNTEKRMEARRLRRSAFTVSRFLEPLMRNEARVFELASQTNVKSL